MMVVATRAKTRSLFCTLPEDDASVAVKMHYLEAGKGDPIVFVHGMPTHSYLWRNILPKCAPYGRCIALDLMGMGASSKPDSAYTVFDHIDYFSAFMQVLDLQNVTLVVHGWGSVIALGYAVRHPERIKAVALYESHLRSTSHWDMLSLPVQEFASLLSSPLTAYRAIIKHNYLVEKLLPSGVMRRLSEAEMGAYRKPFPDAASRRLLWQYAQELPLGGGQTPVTQLIDRYSNWMCTTDIPKLLLYAVPGFITTIDTVVWAKSNFSELSLYAMDHALHFAQETNPDMFADGLVEWLQRMAP